MSQILLVVEINNYLQLTKKLEEKKVKFSFYNKRKGIMSMKNFLYIDNFQIKHRHQVIIIKERVAIKA